LSDFEDKGSEYLNILDYITRIILVFSLSLTFFSKKYLFFLLTFNIFATNLPLFGKKGIHQNHDGF